MEKISTGIPDLDSLIDSFYIGDNVVWEVDAGTAYTTFIRNFIRQSFIEQQVVIYVSFNRSPQSITADLGRLLSPEHFILIDCFTGGKGKNDNTFLRFYETPRDFRVIRIENPRHIGEFTLKLSELEDSLSAGARYVFDSLTGMQDLWNDENDTYQFFTFMCPRLFDLETIAYWILEKDAHSQKFKANLRHITQVVFDLSTRRDKLSIRALKLDGRQNRELFKSHQYEIQDDRVSIAVAKREVASNIGDKVRSFRVSRGMNQKELAQKINVTPSFVSQVENNQISPSLSSFLQICSALGLSPGNFFDNEKKESVKWVIRKEKALLSPQPIENGITVYPILTEDRFAASFVTFPPNTRLSRHFFHRKSPEFVHVMSGTVTITIEGKSEDLGAGDSVFLKESFPTSWRNEGGDGAELLVIW